jgi:hypothetical protein
MLMRSMEEPADKIYTHRKYISTDEDYEILRHPYYPEDDKTHIIVVTFSAL